MFGGKQVVVCGYGEVEWIFCRFRRDLGALMNTLGCYSDIYLLLAGGKRLLRRPQSDGLHCLRDRD